jgi:hypothetical protein
LTNSDLSSAANTKAKTKKRSGIANKSEGPQPSGDLESADSVLSAGSSQEGTTASTNSDLSSVANTKAKTKKSSAMATKGKERQAVRGLEPAHSGLPAGSSQQGENNVEVKSRGDHGLPKKIQSAVLPTMENTGLDQNGEDAAYDFAMTDNANMVNRDHKNNGNRSKYTYTAGTLDEGKQFPRGANA